MPSYLRTLVYAGLSHEHPLSICSARPTFRSLRHAHRARIKCIKSKVESGLFFVTRQEFAQNKQFSLRKINPGWNRPFFFVACSGLCIGVDDSQHLPWVSSCSWRAKSRLRNRFFFQCAAAFGDPTGPCFAFVIPSRPEASLHI